MSAGDPIGWTSLTNMGDALAGEIGAEFDVRLVSGKYSVGLFTTNVDPDEVGVDPWTGGDVPDGYDTGFGAPIRRWIQAGLYNGDFASRPSNYSEPISDQNPLPYWTFTQSAGSNITVQWVEDATAGSGGVLRFTAATSVASNDNAYIEQMAPVIASADQQYHYIPRAYVTRLDGSTNSLEFYVEGQYLDSAGATTGTFGESATEVPAGTAGPAVLGVNGGFIPTDANRIRVRVGLRAIGTIATERRFDVAHATLNVGQSDYFIVDTSNPTTYDMGRIRQDGGVVGIWSGDPTYSTADRARLLIDNPDGFARFHDLQLGVGEGTSTLAPGGQLEVETGSAARVPLVVRGATSQSSNYVTIENAAGVDVLSVAPSGLLTQNATADLVLHDLNRYQGDATATIVRFQKSRNGTVGSHTVLQSGDNIGQFRFSGSDGVQFRDAVRITASVDGTPTGGGAADMPGKLTIATSAAGSATPSNRLSVDAAGTVEIMDALVTSDVLSPASLGGAGTTSDYAPSGIATATILRLTSTGTRNLTGITTGAAGRHLYIFNIGANNIVLQHDVTSTAANRFYCPGSVDYTVLPNGGVMVIYDGTSSRWRLVA